MKRVEFLRHSHIYNAGEIAGFDDAYAQRLVSQGAARYVPEVPTEAEQAPVHREMTREEELAALGVDTSTKEDSEEELRQKALRRPPRDKMVKGSQTK